MSKFLPKLAIVDEVWLSQKCGAHVYPPSPAKELYAQYRESALKDSTI